MTLGEIFHPIDTGQFLEDYFGRAYLRVEGARGRYARLAPWDALSAHVNTHRIAGGRLRLFKNGKPIEKTRYLEQPDAEMGSRLKPAGFISELRAGATLVLDAVDEIFPLVGSVTEALENLLRAPVQVNLYGGWRTDNGFALHWDDHDTLILQVAGRKHWRVYEPTRLHPLKHDVSAAQPPGADVKPVWEGDLHDGDLLYMPRGWWHVAFPKNEPSLHLTAAIGQSTGVDLLNWIAKELRAEALVRADLPRLAGSETQRKYVGDLLDLVRQRMTPDIVERFTSRREDLTAPRRGVRLPDDIDVNGLAMNDDDLLWLAGSSRISVTPAADGSVMFETAGREWSCERTVASALTLLRSNRGVRLSALNDAVPNQQRPELRLLIMAMAASGAIVSSRAVK